MGEKQVLVIASKVKAYVKAQGGLKCSGDVAEVLTDRVSDLLDAAIEAAKGDKRLTLKARDFAEAAGVGNAEDEAAGE